MAQKSIYFEQKTLKEVVGSQDQIAVCYGGFNRIVFNTGGSFGVNPIIIKKKILDKFNKNLLLVYTGISRTSHTIAKSYSKKLRGSKKNDILDIINLTIEGEKLLKQGDLNDFAKLLHESWLVKKSLSSSISNHYIDDIYNNAIKKGALGGKLLGAGGGGFLLLYVPYFKQKSFIKFFKKLITIPFKFSSEGSKIMFTTKNKK